MIFSEKDTQWTSKDLAELPTALVMSIALAVYQKGDKPRALALIQEGAKAPTSHGNSSIYRDMETAKFREACIKANDLDTIELLPQIAPNWFGGQKALKMGGVSLAIVSNNKEMLQLLLASGTKPDTLSSHEVGKANPDLVKRIKPTNSWSGNTESYEGLSAFYWAVVSGDTDAAKMLVEKFPDDVKLTRSKQQEKKGVRGGHQGYTTVVYEDVWGSVVAAKQVQAAQWLFDHPLFKEQIFKQIEPTSNQWNSGRPSHGILFESLEVLTKDQERQIWDHIETPPKSYAAGTPLVEFAWKNSSTTSFRTRLMEIRPEKYLEYLEKYARPVEHGEWKHALQRGTLDVVKALAKKYPHWLKQTWEDTPADTRRTKRQKGPLSEAFFNTKNENVVEWLSKQPGVMEAEAATIQEYLARGWGHNGYNNPHRPSQANQTEQNEWETKRKQALNASWERLRLKKRIDLDSQEPTQPHIMTKAL